MGQPKVLEYLMEHDGAEQKEIAAGCHVEAPSLTSILNRMERDGLIERRMLRGNRRSYHIFVTAKGKEKQQRVAEGFAEVEKLRLRGCHRSGKDGISPYVRDSVRESAAYWRIEINYKQQWEERND